MGTTEQQQVPGINRIDLQEHDLTVPAQVAHSATGVGDAGGTELATFIVEKGKPLITLAE